VEEFQVSVVEFIMRYPNTIDKNFYLAYIRKENALKQSGQKLDSVNLNWDLNFPESLIEMCIKTISDNWDSEEINWEKGFENTPDLFQLTRCSTKSLCVKIVACWLTS
jgi:hypothetical protein